MGDAVSSHLPKPEVACDMLFLVCKREGETQTIRVAHQGGTNAGS